MEENDRATRDTGANGVIVFLRVYTWEYAIRRAWNAKSGGFWNRRGTLWINRTDRTGIVGQGFNLDDWEIGFQSEVKLHKTPTKKDIENGYRKNELIALFDLPAHWLMSQMNSYCVGANYVFLDGKHYYTVHHA